MTKHHMDKSVAKPAPQKIIVDAATSCNTRTQILFSHWWQLVSNDVSSD